MSNNQYVSYMKKIIVYFDYQNNIGVLYKIQTSYIIQVIERINPSKHTRTISEMGFQELLLWDKERALQGQLGRDTDPGSKREMVDSVVWEGEVVIKTTSSLPHFTGKYTLVRVSEILTILYPPRLIAHRTSGASAKHRSLFLDLRRQNLREIVFLRS